MPEPLPHYPYPDIASGGIDFVERIGTFDEILEGVNREGLVNYAPTSEQAAGEARANLVRNRTTSTRLWLLGYLPHKPPENATAEELFTGEFRDAVRRFQEEAGLEVDGWVGDQTWYALDELVSFESALQLHRWFDGSQPRPALSRAVQLRLFALGLADAGPGPEFGEVSRAALDDFLRINLMFGLTGSPLPGGVFPRTVAALFDQDGIVEKLAAAGSPAGHRFEYRRLPSMGANAVRNLAGKFIINVAKVELWLLGLDVGIDGKNDYLISGHNGYSYNEKLRKALVFFWEDLERIGGNEATRRARRITPHFFVSLQKTGELAGRSEPSDQEDYSAEIARELDSNDRIEAAWNFVKTRSVSLWDGLQRLWRWIKRGVKAIVSFLTKNIYRAFFRYASKAYKIVRTSIGYVVTAIDYYLQGGLTGSTLAQAAVLHDRDFDQTVFVNAGASPLQVEALADRLTVQAAIFRFATAVLNLVFETFKRIAPGVIGWARVLLALVCGLREIKPLYARIKLLTAQSPA